MKYHFNTIVNRRHNGSMKWDKNYIKKRFHIDIDESDIYPMFIADMDFHMCDEVKSHLVELIQDPDFGYFNIKDSFYLSIINWYKDIHHINISKEWIVPSVGTITSMHLACDMVARNQDVVIMTPVYGPFLNCAKIGNPLILPLLLDNNKYVIDYESLEQLFIHNDVKALLLCNPHNPGGRVWSKEELERLVLLCKQYQVVILSDEIHGDFIIGNQRYTSLIEFSDLYDQIIVSTSPNKTFNISGLTTSFVLISNHELRNQYINYLNCLHISVNRLGIDMIEYVYTYGKDWYKELIEVLKENIKIISETCREIGFDVMDAEGGFLVWVHLDHTDINEFILDLAKQKHVLLETGARFVDDFEGWVRINGATSPDLVKEAMKRLKEYMLERKV